MSPSTINNTPVDSNSAMGTRSPFDQVAGSTRCAKEGCNSWAEANSRFCTSHQG
ncbi:hypothetical protein AK830_g8645 [Neonectria ditissima]|uniref:Uncharacterized protein n=1 Tax=Neonectria ditissima TaxID=78410 RepID=A0A0P7BAV0_9HYPO|nr:hypothetical protein AK830_g8645 [Neonectria ditissima]